MLRLDQELVGRIGQSTGIKLLLLAALIVGVYFPGRAGPFLADDFPNIIDNPGLLLEHLNTDELAAAWSSNTSGPLKRPLANLSFALNFYFSGQHFDPVAFKLTNVGIHVINAILVFFLSRTLFRVVLPHLPYQRLALISALLWGLHPLQLSSVLYTVQRMTSMASLFMLAGFLVFLRGRLRLHQPGGLAFMVAGCVLGVVLGGLCKENALLLPLLIFVVELTLLPRVPESSAQNKLLAYYAVSVGLPVLLGVGYLCLHPEYILNGYVARDFSLSQRLMTEARALFYYLGLLFYPDNTQLSLFYDDFPLSKSLFQPWNTVFAILGIVGLLLLATYNLLRKKAIWLTFAILWFFVAHSMESSLIALELIYEHRNYLPSIGVAMAVSVLLHQLLAQRISRILLNMLYICLIASLALSTYMRATIWSTRQSFSYFQVRNHPDSPRANAVYANSMELLRGPNAESYQYFLRAAQLSSFEVSTLVDVFLELNKLIRQHDAAQDQANIALPMHYDDPLLLNGRYMLALKELVHQEILRRIQARTYPLRTLVMLRMTTVCLTNGQPECQSIADELLAWIDATLQQPDFADRETLYLIRAKVYFNQGKETLAFESIDQAIALAPDRMYFYAEKAALYIILNQFEQAEQVLVTAEARGHLTGFEAYDFKKLRAIMASRKPAALPQ